MIDERERVREKGFNHEKKRAKRLSRGDREVRREKKEKERIGNFGERKEIDQR